MAKTPPRRRRKGSTDPESPPQIYWDVTMLEAQQAYTRRWWATLGRLLALAREAPDAPDLDYGSTRQDVQAWHDLMDNLVLHQIAAQDLVTTAVEILVQQMQDRLGALGAPDPTP